MSKILVSFIMIELILSIYLGISISRIKKNCLSLINTKKSENFDLRSTNANLAKNNCYRIQTENIRTSISDSIHKNNFDSVLILRLHEEICINCFTDLINYSIPTIRKQKHKLLILGSFKYNSVMNEIIDDLGLSEFESINLSNILSLPADSANSPYFFTITNNKIVKNTYIFQKDDSQSLCFYLNSLHNSYRP